MIKMTVRAAFASCFVAGIAYASDGTVEEDVGVADVAAGEDAYQSVCKNCHGPNAQGVASYPGLADKDKEYLVERLEVYRSGEKVGPNSLLMIPHAKDLSDDDILNISTYITTLSD